MLPDLKLYQSSYTPAGSAIRVGHVVPLYRIGQIYPQKYYQLNFNPAIKNYITNPFFDTYENSTMTGWTQSRTTITAEETIKERDRTYSMKLIPNTAGADAKARYTISTDVANMLAGKICTFSVLMYVPSNFNYTQQTVLIQMYQATTKKSGAYFQISANAVTNNYLPYEGKWTIIKLTTNIQSSEAIVLDVYSQSTSAETTVEDYTPIYLSSPRLVEGLMIGAPNCGTLWN